MADEHASETTGVGHHFVANYPPFSCWTRDDVPRLHARLDGAAEPDVPLGVYVHLPFCRKRCDFCFYRVYTDKDSQAIRRYLDAVLAELRAYATRPLLRDRAPLFVYFGGGTPSYLSVEQLSSLFAGIRRHLDLSHAQEITFECEPGTLQESKVSALRELGVTRLSLGIESFDGEVLAQGNRAHRIKEVDAAWRMIEARHFPQVNVDLIAGMLGETDASWQRGIERVRALRPDSVTIYPLEVPHNATLARRLDSLAEPPADWPTKRRWIGAAFAALEGDGYSVGSAYTAQRGERVRFLYRDWLWRGADLLGLGVSSFSHLGGVHCQNEHDFEPYVSGVERGELPILRALALSDDERLVRELVLQMKLGVVELAPLAEKFGLDVRARFKEPLDRLARAGMLSFSESSIRLSRAGLLQVDGLLRAFFRPEHQHVRYA